MNSRHPRIHPLVACLYAAFSLSTPLIARASAYVVNSCGSDSSSPGTLRWAIASASDHDHIDLHTSLPLVCSKITLTAGELKPNAGVNNLYLDGPSDRTLTIFQSEGTGASGGPYFRIFNHTGAGTLGIYNLTLDSGKYYSASGSAAGGCIYSAGYVKVDRSTITNCTVTTAKPSGGFPAIAQGGAIYAKQGVKLTHSRITANLALDLSAGANETSGAGIATGVRLRAYYSTISGNNATSAASSHGGAVSVGGNVSISNSTIDSNAADFAAAIYHGKIDSSSYLQINNSTISGNNAAAAGTAIYSNAKTYIYNSTIAFNSGRTSAAVDVRNDATLLNSILARDTNQTGGFTDLYVDSPYTLTGSHNLIMSSNQSIVGETTLTSDPQLTPLANHGGETRVHALLATSPAVNAGIAVSTPIGAGWDQRGSPYSHSVGGPDIGAYERQSPDDEIFYNGLDP